MTAFFATGVSTRKPNPLRVRTLRWKENGRGARIRTEDFLLPKQARYRAAPRPDTVEMILRKTTERLSHRAICPRRPYPITGRRISVSYPDRPPHRMIRLTCVDSFTATYTSHRRLALFLRPRVFLDT